MKILGTIVLIAVIGSGLAMASPATPEPTSVPEVAVPPDDCFGRTYTCQAKLSFTVGEDGRASDIKVLESSRSYPCDRALIYSLRGRTYPELVSTAYVEEHLIGYQCIDGRPANNSFKAMPLHTP
ncbi:hypothetical protein LDO26_06740 [Luteimonas sp. BDR2-5]|uniref:energy transducer TonB n=1 Tax=Proluteimonas luteida TaxID=2878685 RepID=UPI001E3C691F|nr:hypothetical protein [Luteimonas sp. BDR2-5]MCD9027901.1 hypothetical protein [Luteimonas sp. BDR2-5]